MSRELALYLAAAAAYILLGVANTNLLWSWVEGAGFLLLVVWVLPALAARMKR